MSRGRLTLVTGGARSGKSAHAERLAGKDGGSVVFVATAQPLDEEMRSRIAAHRQKRPRGWDTLEVPVDVGKSLLTKPPEQELVLLDCVTLLVSNRLMEAGRDPTEPDADAARVLVEAEIEKLLEAVDSLPVRWIVVTNEVGQGVVPAYPMGRLFRDLLGQANRQLAERADEVILMVAGIPMPIGGYRDSSRNS